ncbi:type II secretion system F family protein [Shewanella sp. FJAT-52076]|uniref:type II secretion system F family protein n=1 Tax=Shewanella sp. FJAT-52076 TaxID=2864202 RepID=UPI001C660B87|nr:type II secretion system F family protein [Shewanella sp. FJAT-52076]QYJ74057.1 type II secretion system F family protein [Shewanella sp. FJAT-52076]
MPSYSYKAYDSNGVMIQGHLDARDEPHAYTQLESLGLHVVTLVVGQPSKGLSLGRHSITLDDLEFFTAELALLLRNGVKLDRSVQLLAKGKKGTALGDLLTEIHRRVKQGETLSDVLKDYSYFDNLYINLIKIGEATGELSHVFAGLAKDLKFRKDLRAKIIQSMSYPTVIFIVCVLAVLFVFNYIVPQMGSLFEDNPNVPVYTQFLLSASDWLRSYQWYLALILLASGVSLFWLQAQGKLSGVFDEVLLKIPLLRSAINQIERIRFCTGMALMLDSGVKLDKAIELAADTVKNRLIRHRLKAVKIKVSKGERLTDAFLGLSVFPDFFISLVEVGEESGQLTSVFEEIANRSREQFTNWSNRITTILEPLMILFMGAIVGSVVVVMLLSVMSVNDGI